MEIAMLQLWGPYKHWTKGPGTRGPRVFWVALIQLLSSISDRNATTNLRLCCCVSQYSPTIVLFHINRWLLSVFLHSVKAKSSLFERRLLCTEIPGSKVMWCWAWQADWILPWVIVFFFLSSIFYIFYFSSFFHSDFDQVKVWLSACLQLSLSLALCALCTNMLHALNIQTCPH